MATVQQWGCKESIIWPPRGYVYTLGAFIFACILTGIFVWIRFQYGLSPLERYYLPYYLRTETAALTHPVSKYQLLHVSDGEKLGRVAVEGDVQPGSTPQLEGKPVPLMLTPEASKKGTFYLLRESLTTIKTKRSMQGLPTGFIRTLRFTASSGCNFSLGSLPSHCNCHFQFPRTFGASRIFVMGGA
jgi:hypothetical protein